MANLGFGVGVVAYKNMEGCHFPSFPNWLVTLPGIRIPAFLFNNPPHPQFWQGSLWDLIKTCYFHTAKQEVKLTCPLYRLHCQRPGQADGVRSLPTCSLSLFGRGRGGGRTHNVSILLSFFFRGSVLFFLSTPRNFVAGSKFSPCPSCSVGLAQDSNAILFLHRLGVCVVFIRHFIHSNGMKMLPVQKYKHTIMCMTHSNFRSVKLWKKYLSLKWWTMVT